MSCYRHEGVLCSIFAGACKLQRGIELYTTLIGKIGSWWVNPPPYEGHRCWGQVEVMTCAPAFADRVSPGEGKPRPVRSRDMYPTG